MYIYIYIYIYRKTSASSYKITLKKSKPIGSSVVNYAIVSGRRILIAGWFGPGATQCRRRPGQLSNSHTAAKLTRRAASFSSSKSSMARGTAGGIRMRIRIAP